MNHRFLLSLLCASALVALAGALILSDEASPAFADADDGQFIGHPSVVDPDPELGYPRILDTPTEDIQLRWGIRIVHRETSAVDMIGNYIVSGGNFLNIQLQNGTTISQPHLAVFDTRTKDLVCQGLTTDKEVLAIVRGHEPDTVIIGGAFNSVTGTNGTFFRSKVAKVSLDTCEVDTSWEISGVSAKVSDFALTMDRLFIAGDFTSIDGEAISHLAELDHKTGSLNPDLSFQFTGGSAFRKITTIGAKDDGSRLAVIGKFTAIDGVPLRGTAIFDITNEASPVLTAHRLATDSLAYIGHHAIRGGAVAPDFSYMVITMQGGHTFDAVTKVPTVETSNQFAWQQKLRDSVFSAAISNHAIYVGGHFCRVDTGPGGAGLEMTPNILDSCTGSLPALYDGVPGLWRSQLAALDPVDGTPLPWNPGTQAQVGSKALTVVNRGLLMGQDGVFVHSPNPFMRVGTTAFFDFGEIAEPRTNQTCQAIVNADNSVSVSWSPVAGVSSFDLVRNDEEIVRVDGLATTDTPGLGTWDYEIRSVRYGTVWDTSCTPAVTITPAAVDCAASLNGDDSVTLVWDAVAGVDNFQLRRNGAWVASTGDVLTVEDDPGVGTWSYEIRYWQGGAQDIACAPAVRIN